MCLGFLSCRNESCRNEGLPADHGVVQHVAEDAAEPEEATMAEGATAAEDSVTSVEPARANKAAKERALG